MERDIPRIQQFSAILWPSFLTSAFATIVFFSLFDHVHLLAGSAFADLSRMGAYTVGFFMFWALTTATSILTCYYSRPCEKAKQTGPGTITRGSDRHGKDDIKQAM